MRQGRIGTPICALLASLLAHAGLLALVPRRPWPLSAPQQPIEFEVVEVARPPVPAVEGTVPAPPPRRPGPSSSSPPPRTPSGSPPASPPPEVGVGAEPAREAVPLELSPAPPDLSLSWPASGDPGGSAEPAGRAAPTVSPPPDDDRLARRVHDMLVAEAPFRRAREAASPYWLDVKAKLAKEFVVPAEMIEERPGGGFGAQAREAARAYLAQAKQYGETGNPERPEIYAPHAAAIENINEDLVRFQWADVRRIEPGEDATRVVTWVRVVFAADGSVEQTAIERSSGLPAHDRHALEAARSLPSLGPRPPDQSTTLWAFETVLWIIPPLPIAGCAFDATFVPTTCFYPLKRMIRSTVRLEAVE